MDRDNNKYDLFVVVSEILPFMGELSHLDSFELAFWRVRLSRETRR